ncbi:MAG: succinyl-CoA synthetase subunit alpha [Deltaproteobacteria bacterium]|nr:succinyl-CoA synthetase subunit alpha [Deltaproteobacteria bacterium]
MGARRRKNASSAEFDFFIRADLSRFAGQYIAILGQKVVASGSNAQMVWKQAKKRFPSSTPTIAKLPRAETLVLYLRWR